MGLARPRDVDLGWEKRSKLVVKIIGIGSEARKGKKHNRYVVSNKPLDELMKTEHQQPCLVDRVETEDGAPRGHPPMVPDGRRLRHPRRCLVYCLHFPHGAARGCTDKVTNWDDHGVQRHPRITEHFLNN